MPLRGDNSHFSLQGMNMFLRTPHLSSYIIEFEHFVILSSYLLCIEHWHQVKYNRLNAVYTQSLERKRSCLKSLPLLEVFDIDFPFSLPHFLTRRSTSLLVSALSNWTSTGNSSFIFCNRRLEILVADMIFDEICTAHSLVCLCLIASGLVFMNGKRLHHRSRESCIVSKIIEWKWTLAGIIYL